uniref:Metalloendopeptidase n=1 Tax=Parastrongyloides trichosuri TaxID=131310 RepID=A0A0N5A102_PARTI
MVNMIITFALLLCFVLQNDGAIRQSPEHKWDVPSKKIKVFYTADWPWQIEYPLRNIEENTCIRFERMKSGFEKGSIIILHSDKCYSDHIGAKPDKDAVFIYTTHECRHNYYTMLRLYFQALGLSEEHNRDDRDEYINVNFTNVAEQDRSYLSTDRNRTLNTTTFGTGYDYGSILHGSPIYYSKNNDQTIKVLGNYSEWVEKTIGHNSLESFNEYRLLNYLYCNSTCGPDKYEGEKPGCKNFGYQDPNNCSVCKCPYFARGKNCTTIERSNPRCGNTTIFKATPEEQLLQYYSEIDCYIYIYSPQAKRIEITIKNYKGGNCRRGPNSVEIMYRKDKSVMGLCFCDLRLRHFNEVKVVTEGISAHIVYRGTHEHDGLVFSYKTIED